MKSGLEIIIRTDGLVLSHDHGRVAEELGLADDLGETLAVFSERHGIAAKTINLFLSEDLIYVTAIDLPPKTPSISEAISFQLGMLLPFPEEDSLYSYSTIRKDEGFKVTVCAARAQQPVNVVEELISAGYIVKGLYPESQRYVVGKMRKTNWALVMPGKMNKIFVFEGSKLADRLLSGGEALSYRELEDLCGTGEIFHTSPPIASSFSSVRQLMAERPLLKDHNMLPATYRRPDYLKMVAIVLLALNLVGLVALGGFKFVNQGREIKRSAEEISDLMPLVRKTNKTRDQISRTEKFLEQASGFGGNPEIITFMEKLTKGLPESSYLDQLRLDEATRTVTINGYTDDIAELTEKMQDVGESRLKSTSRRKNMIYFQVEISLP
jgi:hypothetical protein